jgi:hypothetical protein
MVGDVIEECGDRGRIALWWSVCAVFFSLVWRRGLAFVVALAVGLASFDFLHNLVYNVDGAYLPSNAWRPLLDFVCLASILLSFGMAYSVIRYGLKDAFTHQVTALWGLASLLSAYWWIPVVRIGAVLFGFLILLSAIRSAARRRALQAAILALGFGVVAYVVFGHYLMPGFAASHQHIFQRLEFYVFSLGLVVQPAIYSYVRAAFWRNRLLRGDFSPEPR